MTRLGLVPPIDIASVAGQYAQVERVSALPAGADAVTTSLKVAGVKPSILHSGSVSSNRTRFTLAHELGHIVLPWHIGVIVSHAQFGVVYPSGAYGEMEKEANQFAAEFLAPSLWIDSIVEDNAQLDRMFQRILQGAKVSWQVSVLRLCASVPPGFLFAQKDEAGEIGIAGRSPGTRASTPTSAEELAFLERSCDEKMVMRLPVGSLTLCRFQDPTLLLVDATRPDAELLSLILADVGCDAERARHLTQSIGGVFGSANQTGQTPGELAGRVQQRLASDPKYRGIVAHKQFPQFLANRADTIARRRQERYGR